MNDFSASWSLSRQRLADEVSSLTDAQLNWRLNPSTLAIGEMAIHVAGVELFFISQLTGAALDAEQSRMSRAATEGVVSTDPFPYRSDEITSAFVIACLDAARKVVAPIIESPSEEIRTKVIKSALGPMIDGNGALARLAFHSAYHQGQAYLIKNAEGFPQT